MKFLLKAAVNTIVPRSPLLFKEKSFCTPKYRSLQTLKKMRLNVCIKEMAPFGPFAAIIKGKTPFDSDAIKEVYPRDEIVDPPGTNVFPIDRDNFAEGFVYFRTLFGV